MDFTYFSVITICSKRERKSVKQSLEKKSNAVNSFNNPINNIKEMIT